MCRAINAPIINRVVGGSMPVAIVSKDRNATRKIQDRMSFGIHDNVIRATSSIKKISRQIRKAGSCPLFHYYYNAKILDGILNVLYSEDSETVVFVVFIDAIPPVFQDKFFCIYLDESGVKEDSIEDLLPPAESVPFIMENLSYMRFENGYEAFLKPVEHMIQFEGDDERNELRECIQRMIEENENFADTDGVCDAFIRELYRCIEESEDICMYSIPQIPDKARANMDQSIFLRENFMYISNKMFSFICERLRSSIPIETIKRSLVEGDCLIQARDGKYVHKMPYLKEDGCYARRRMLKFNVESLNMVGRPRIIELCGGLNKV